MDYLICTTERTGSSLLADALSRTSGVGNPLELLHPHSMAQLRARHALATIAERADNASLMDRDSGVIPMVAKTFTSSLTGAKVHWSHLEQLATHAQSWYDRSPAPAALLDEVFPGVRRHIWLSRRDRVRQAVSLLRAETSGRWGWFDGDPPNDSGLTYPEPEQVERTIERLDRHDDAWRQYFIERGLAPLRLNYEDLVKSYELSVCRVLEYLGSRLPAGYSVPPPRMRRQADSWSDAAVARFRGVCRNESVADQEVTVVSEQMTDGHR